MVADGAGSTLEAALWSRANLGRIWLWITFAFLRSLREMCFVLQVPEVFQSNGQKPVSRKERKDAKVIQNLWVEGPWIWAVRLRDALSGVGTLLL